MIDIPERSRGILYVVAAAIFWSFGGLLIKLIELHPMATAGGRSLIAAVVIWALARPLSGRFTRGQVMGALAYAGTVTFFVLATKTTTAANAILLQYTAPVYAALMSHRMLGERITGIDWGAIVVVLLGMALFFFDGLTSGGALGDFYAVISGVFFALCVVLLRRERHGSPFSIVLLGNLMTAVIGLPFMIQQPPTGNDLLLLLPLGVLQLGLGYVFFCTGSAACLGHRRNLDTSNRASPEPDMGRAFPWRTPYDPGSDRRCNCGGIGDGAGHLQSIT